MKFLHKGRPPVVRAGRVSTPPAASRLHRCRRKRDYTRRLCCKILGSPNVASKEWIIRQYDHEVQGGSVVKPLVGVRERRAERRGRAAARARFAARRRDRLRHESALRRLRSRITWPPARSTRRFAIAWPSAPIRSGSRSSTTSAGATASGRRRSAALVRAALACHDVALALGTPFISGKDSLNNEFSYTDASGQAADDRHPAVAADQRDGAGRRRGASA